jgi:hypothetical protein
VSAFVASLGQSLLSDFHRDMINYLTGFKPKVSAKKNVLRIAQKIEGIMKENKIKSLDGTLETMPASKAWARLTDILRLQVFCDTPEDVERLFNETIVPNSGNWGTFEIMRYKVRFTGYLADMTLNFNWRRRCICEL